MEDSEVQPFFLSVDEVLLIHKDQIDRYGGSLGILNPDALDSAVAQPQASFDGMFLYADLFEMASAYLCSLVQNHAFIDGNKRVGTATAIVFLLLNGFQLQAEPDALTEVVLLVAQSKMDRSDVAQFLRESSERTN